MKKEELMIELNSSFQNKIFKELIQKEKGSFKASELLNIPASSVRGYKNLYFNSVPEEILKKLIKVGITTKRNIKESTISKFIKSEKIKNILDNGRIKRRSNLKKLKDSLPSINEITKTNYLDFKFWFSIYKDISSFGIRQIETEDKKDFTIAKYNNYTKQGIKYFEVNLPNKIILNDDFSYFFGLWCGDHSGGKRFGVCNQNGKILDFTFKFLEGYNQKIEKILYITSGMKEPKLLFDKKFVIDKKINGWVLSVHSNNGILASFFYYLRDNLPFILGVINKKAFFAGLFDAEGNVSLYNKSARIACKNENLIGIYTSFLIKMNLYDRYDGNCLITYNIKDFYLKILPFMKQDSKINQFNLLINGKGEWPKRYLEILSFIRKNDNINSKDIAKALKKNKVYSELNLLKNFGFITSISNKYNMTNKGNKLLGRAKL